MYDAIILKDLINGKKKNSADFENSDLTKIRFDGFESPWRSGEIGPERAGAPPQTSPLPPERELRQFLGQRVLLDRSTESLCDAK